MGMLSSSGCSGAQISSTGERCKPDYEGMIERERKALQGHEKFFDALNEYVPAGHCGDQMNLLFGEMHQIIRGSKKTIEQLIKKQEEDN